MHIEQIRLKNFRAFRDVDLRDLPRFAVFVGANGTGKSTLFEVFEFLYDALRDNVTEALRKRGGFEEVRSRGAEGAIEIELKFRAEKYDDLFTYTLRIDERNGRPVVEQEELMFFYIEFDNAPSTVFRYQHGQGKVLSTQFVRSDKHLARAQEMSDDTWSLKSPDLLALKGLSQFENLSGVKELSDLLESFHIFDYNVSKTNPLLVSGYPDTEHLSKGGENLAFVLHNLYTKHRPVFDRIVATLRERVPGIADVIVTQTEEKRILLKLRDGAFESPFSATNSQVSEGTLKMLAYLVLLHEPKPHPLLCIEEPENQLYPSLMAELAEEFRAYAEADNGGQVFVATHSYDFVNAAELDEVYWLEKRDGYTTIHRARDHEQIVASMGMGDHMGWLWQEGFFRGANP